MCLRGSTGGSRADWSRHLLRASAQPRRGPPSASPQASRSRRPPGGSTSAARRCTPTSPPGRGSPAPSLLPESRPRPFGSCTPTRAGGARGGPCLPLVPCSGRHTHSAAAGTPGARSAVTSLDAARALGDSAAEAIALHQLGTREICLGNTAAAVKLLGAALHLRTALGDAVGAQVTQHNLSLLVAPPLPPPRRPPGRQRRRLRPRPVPRAGSDAGEGPRRPRPLDRRADLHRCGDGVAARPADRAGGAAVRRAAPESGKRSPQHHARQPRRDRDARRRARPRWTRPRPVHHHGSTCSGEVAAGRSCTTTVVFTPTDPGDRQAALTWDVRETSDDPVSTLTGAGTSPASGFSDGGPPLAGVRRPAAERQQRAPADPARCASVRAGRAPIGVDRRVQAADYLLDGDSCSGVRLAPGAACTASVRFTPSAEGARSALLTITSADGRTAARCRSSVPARPRRPKRKSRWHPIRSTSATRPSRRAPPNSG